MKEENKKTNWIPTIVSIVIGVLITVGATWYTIYSSKEELVKAENERYTKVKENLVSIIEEHIVNKDSLNLNAFERLITNRIIVENLSTHITIFDLLTQAEYNIENSKHLSFDKKKEYSYIVSSLYTQLASDTTIRINNGRFPSEITRITNSFSETKENEGKQGLANLINQYETKIKDLEKDNVKKESFTKLLFESPSRLLIIMSTYLLIMGAYWYYLQNRRKRRRREAYMREEIQRIEELLRNSNLPQKEEEFLKEKLDMLYWELHK